MSANDPKRTSCDSACFPQVCGSTIDILDLPRTGNVSGGEAALQILLPIAAVAFGMTIFGLVFLFTVPHLGAH